MSVVSSNVTVSTITTGGNGYGENVSALGVSLSNLMSVVVSSRDDSEVYFTQGSTIRKIRKSGTLETIAGTGQAGYNIDHDGKAIRAQLNSPNFLLLNESNGDLYFSDKDNYLIRKLDSNGSIYDIAGVLGQSSIVDGNFSVATFSSISSLAFNSNSDIYVTDSNCLRLISLIHANVTTLYCGNTDDRYYSVVVSSEGDIYLSEGYSYSILKLKSDMSNTTVIAGSGIYGFKDGNALESLFDNPISMFLKESTQELFISSNKRIRKLNLQTQQVSTIVGGAAQTYDSYTAPNTGLNVYLGNSLRMSYNYLTNSIYIVDNEIFIRKVDLNNSSCTSIIAGSIVKSTVYGTSYERTVFNGYYVSHNVKGNAYLQTSVDSIIQFKDGLSSLVYKYPSLAEDLYPINVKPATNSLYFSDNRYFLHQYFYNGTHIDMTPDFYGIENVPASQAISDVSYLDMQFDKNGDIYFLKRFSIRKISVKTGIISTIYAENKNTWLNSLAIMDNGDIIFSDETTIRKVESKNSSTILVGIPGRTDLTEDGFGYETTTYYSLGLTYNPLDGLIYYCDREFNRIRTYNFTSKLVNTTSGGIIGFSEGTVDQAQYRFPSSLALDVSTGYIYIADRDNDIIRRIANGTVTTIAGIPTQYGDIDGPLLSAKFTRPHYISTIDGDEFIIKDSIGIRRMSLSKDLVETLTTFGSYGDGLPLSKDNTRIGYSEFARKSPYSGDLYWGDNSGIRKADNLTNIVSTITYKLKVDETIHYSKTMYNTNGVMDFNAMGELIFYDSTYYIIRKLDRNGMISVLVGSGYSSPNYTFTENMKATDILLGNIGGITVCTTDNLLYWTDTDAAKIFKLNADGTVSTVAENVGIGQICCTKFGTFVAVEGDYIKVFSNNTLSTLIGQSGPGYLDGSVDVA